MAAAVGPEAQYTKEERLSIVMYGGVSLAIYIGGVARELLALVRASAPDRTDNKHAAVPAEKLAGSEKVYRKLAQWNRTAATSPLDSHVDAPLLTRYLIDVISGTSAGGINGIFLARALAEGRTLDAVSQLWIEEGDLGKLLNDSRSVQGLGLQVQKPPVSLLNGQRMFRKLLGAFEGMQPGAANVDPGDRIDLYVTTTDVRGEIVKLKLANGYATEKRYRQAFQFVYEPSSQRNDFRDDRKARLAFAARCTSSFPFAFEPFTWADASRLAAVKDDNWNEHFLFHSGAYENRPLCDGGYLDNKPFSYVVEEMAKRHSELPAFRTLFYVEPDPGALDEAAQKELQETKPNAIENAMDALISLPGYETIREDLERVLERNRRVDFLQELATTISEKYVDATADRATLRTRCGASYAAYHRIKIETVKEAFSELVCISAGIGQAELQQVMRELVGRWVGQTYTDDDAEDQLLLDLDFRYRQRKIAFLLRRATDGAVQSKLKDLYDATYALQRLARTEFSPAAREFYAKLRPTLEAIADTVDGDSRAAKLDGVLAQLPLDQLQAFITSIRPKMRDLAHQLNDLIATEGSAQLKRDLAAFEQYDMVLFPLEREANVGQPVHVDVARISPLDAKLGPGVTKLFGTRLGHFGAFLEADWRRNDILWGRLDGAEIVIRQMMRGANEQAIVDTIAAAHAEIIDDLVRDLQARITANQTAPPAHSPQTAAALAAAALLNDKAKMVDYFADGNGYDSGFDRGRQASNAARAGQITEKVVAAIARVEDKPIPRVGAALLSFLVGLVNFSIPQSMARLVFHHIAQLAAIVFGVLAIGGYVTKTDGVTSIGLRGFGFVIAVVVLSALLADWFRGRLEEHWLAAIQALGSFIVLAMAAVIVATSVTAPANMPAWLFGAWTAIANWFVLLERAVPHWLVLAVEVGIIIVGFSLVKGAAATTPKEPAA